MLITEFSKYLKENKEKNSIILLNEWIKERLERASLNKVDIILKTELYYLKNKSGSTLIIAKSESGRTLLNALYNFSLSFEQYKIAKFLHDSQNKHEK